MHRSGFSKVDQLKWAILETDGKISFIPCERSGTEAMRAGKEVVE